jgi:hypothetical protein
MLCQILNVSRWVQIIAKKGGWELRPQLGVSSLHSKNPVESNCADPLRFRSNPSSNCGKLRKHCGKLQEIFKILWKTLHDFYSHWTIDFRAIGLTHRNRVSLQELAMNLKVASRNPVSPQLCVSPAQAGCCHSPFCWHQPQFPLHSSVPRTPRSLTAQTQ